MSAVFRLIVDDDRVSVGASRGGVGRAPPSQPQPRARGLFRAEFLEALVRLALLTRAPAPAAPRSADGAARVADDGASATGYALVSLPSLLRRFFAEVCTSFLRGLLARLRMENRASRPHPR